MTDPRPKIIQDTGFEFDWDDKKVWALPVEAEEVSIDDFLWHLDLPVWEKENTDDWNLTPNDALNNLDREPNHAKKIAESNLDFPIDIMWNKGRWTLLDGYHRLARAHQLGDKTIHVRKIPQKYVPEITTFLWKDYHKENE
ncbi:MAG: hypothetical protein WCG99_03455 [Candidatus Berkelbacteria bacterium]